MKHDFKSLTQKVADRVWQFGPMDWQPEWDALADNDNQPIPKVDAFLNSYLKGEGIRLYAHDSTPAYAPTLDLIKIPHPKRFKDSEAFYTTLLHEIGHSTMKAMNRPSEGEMTGKDEAIEEATAELFSVAMSNALGLKPRVNRAAKYLSNHLWIAPSRDEGDAAVKQAMDNALKAVDYAMKYVA